jgi:methyl-accepting chemotaxis protein
MNFRLRISHKLPLYIAGAALLSGLVIGIGSYTVARQEISKEVEQKLIGIVESRKSSLTAFLETITQDLQIMAVNEMIQQTTAAMAGAYREFGKTPTEQLHKLYITDNENPVGQKFLLSDADDDSEYTMQHSLIHDKFRIMLEKRGYEDVFLIDMQANVVYSVMKGSEYATNLGKGPWKDTGLAAVFKTAAAAKERNMLAITDIAPYAPDNGKAAGFVALKVFADDDIPLGVLVFRLPLTKIDSIMQQTAGLGKSGESYIVGRDFLMRSNSRFSQAPTILVEKAESATAHAALQGVTGISEISGKNGTSIMSAHVPFGFLDLQWAVLTDIDSAEAFVGVGRMRFISMIIGAVVVLVVGLLGFLLSRTIATPLVRLTRVMGALSSGDNDIEVPYQSRPDELGEMGNAVQVFKHNAIEKLRLEADDKAATEQRVKQEEIERQKEADEQAVRLEKQSRMNDLTSSFGSTVEEVLGVVASSASDMEASARSMSTIAGQTEKESIAVASAAAEASTSVQTVASATAELSASIAEISSQVAHSAEIAGKAVSAADATNVTIKKLSEAGQRVGEVVDLINDIAEQTNLLALNATIEAARAGEAGKGFAVVASEVKNLASQTANATDGIRDQINEIQGATQEAVSAIEGISSTITEMNEIAASISSAIDEQGNATTEISRNIKEAAEGTQNVSTSIVTVKSGSGQTGEASGEVLEASKALGERFQVLQEKVEEFLGDLKTI